MILLTPTLILPESGVQVIEQVIAQPRLQFSVLSSPIHGKGLFAEANLASLVLICEESVKLSKKGLVFDGPLRWVNHSRNPNAFLVTKMAEDGITVQLKLFSKRKIRSGEEITYDYTSTGHQGEATGCNCGQPDCSGFFHLRIEFGETV